MHVELAAPRYTAFVLALLIRQRDEQRDAIRTPHGTRDVSLTARVLSEQNVTRVEADLGAVSELHLTLAAQSAASLEGFLNRSL